MVRILVVDDDEIMRTLLASTLTGAGYTVEESEDGRQAVKQLSVKPADLVIVDIFMPGKDGIETIQELKSNYHDLKIIAISGGGLTREMVFLNHAQIFGADRTFTKPLDWEAMLEAIRELVGPGDASAEKAKPLKVLVIDDDPVLLEITRAVLQGMGHKVLTRREAPGSTAEIVRERPDVVLVDIEMPTLQGDKLIRLIRERDSLKGGKEPVFVLYSASPGPELDRLVKETGAAGAIQKTGSASSFASALEKLLRRLRIQL